MQSGSKVVSFSIATSETWTDRASGERKEKTQWHRIVIFNERIGEVAERFLKKGAKVYVEGALETRKYTDQSGAEKEITEVVLKAFRGELTMLDGRSGGEGGMGEGGGSYTPRERAPARAPAGGGERPASRGPSWESTPKRSSDLDDDIPF